jgi:RsiW-degrading membrane proteinase PrsW (M82 family)
MTERGRRVLGAVLVVVVAIWLARVLAGTPLVVLVAAVAPAAIYVAAICWIQRGAGRPPVLLLASLVWGAVAAAFLARALNDLGRAWVAVLAGSDDARAVSSTLLAPIVEEGVKALGLVLLMLAGRRRDFAGVRDGIVYGALIGVGFVVSENLLYFMFAILQGGQAGLARSVYLRGFLAGANHAVFTATMGAGIGWALAATSVRVRVLATALAAAAALVQHLAWNALAADALTRVLCGAEAAGGACRPTPAAGDLFAVVPVVVTVFLGPGAVALLYLWTGVRRAQEE